MDADKIIQDLNRKFAAPLPEFYKRRIVIWYDEDREFEDQIDSLTITVLAMHIWLSVHICTQCARKGHDMLSTRNDVSVPVTFLLLSGKKY